MHHRGSEPVGEGNSAFIVDIRRKALVRNDLRQEYTKCRGETGTVARLLPLLRALAQFFRSQD